jgi:hypothetical protein
LEWAPVRVAFFRSGRADHLPSVNPNGPGTRSPRKMGAKLAKEFASSRRCPSGP